jgi:hypothetical protein
VVWLAKEMFKDYLCICHFSQVVIPDLQFKIKQFCPSPYTAHLPRDQLSSLTAMWLDAQAELTITTNTQAVLFDMPIALFRAR